MRTKLAITLALSLLFVAPAGANPISSQVLRLRQVPKTTHVQVTYASIAKDVPLELKRDGAAVVATWTAFADFTANTGSGLVKIHGQQFCDCYVAVGQHKYEVKFSGAMGPVLSGNIDVVNNYVLPTPKDAGVGKDMMPWDIPEPPALQGLDCTTKCADKAGDGPAAKADGPAAKADGPRPATDGPKADSGTPVNPLPKDDSGCALAGRPAGASLLLLAAGLLLAALLLRRRA